MKNNRPVILHLILILVMLIPVIAACTPLDNRVDGYTAVIPGTMYSGQKTGVSVSLFNGDAMATSPVTFSLLKNGEKVFQTTETVFGKGALEFQLPALPEGKYTFTVQGNSFSDKTPVTISDSFLIFLQSDKPVYKPGQTVHIRTVSVNSELKPVSGPLTVEVMDAKGIKVLRKELTSDDYGFALVDLPLSSEPNLGTWKLLATSGKQKTQLDIKVEKYVLPKYEVKVDLPREWYLVNEAVKGEITAEYSFGKPVAGELIIKASRYVGEWEEFASISKTINGTTSFELPAVNYVSGVPGAGGLGNILLEVTVREKATGYEEKTSRFFEIAPSPLVLQLIPESPVFKPGLPFQVLVVSESPGNKPLDRAVKIRVIYQNIRFGQVGTKEYNVITVNGKHLLTLTPNESAAIMKIAVSAEGISSQKTVGAGYSPSGNFIHLEQTSPGIPLVGDTISFRVYSTKQASNFYYEVVSLGRVVFSDYSKKPDISFKATPGMAPSSKILVYQILPNAEVAADELPFSVTADYPHNSQVQFDKDEVMPGEKVGIDFITEGPGRVGLQVVDRSVFILAENRLNLQQVFDELENLYMKPQAELHAASPIPPDIYRGAREVFENSGFVILSNKTVPSGEEYKNTLFKPAQGGPAKGGIVDMPLPLAAMPFMAQSEAARDAAGTPPAPPQAEGQLAEVQRIRQYFPETWLWQTVDTDLNGRAYLQVTSPDTITTWKLFAVSMSKDKGLGMAESQLKTFQPFFLSIDLPYSVIRGETFPIKVAVYNYMDIEQDILVELAPSPWLEILDTAGKNIIIGPNDIGGVEFKVRPTRLGINDVKVTARSSQFADAVVKPLIIEPEGVEREETRNIILSAGNSAVINAELPMTIVDGSGRVYLTVTGSYLTQTLEGLENLLKMPFGCGEQNMILLAPNIFVTDYLTETGQIKPEIMAKAEKLMLTGYQRELTYRRQDGSFSAFGQNDREGSLWLTAFVLKTFAQAKDLIYIDSSVLDDARTWIVRHQNPAGYFDPVGFVAHQEMMGGVSGRDALTAYVTVALLEAGDNSAAGQSVRYLENNLPGMENPYTVAITAYALELAGSPVKDKAYEKLISLASQDENGLYWASPLPELLPQAGIRAPRMPETRTTDIEATAYAALALNLHGDRFNAGRAARWLTSKRNAYGGYGSTQDTVVTLQALTDYARKGKTDVDLKLTLDIGKDKKEIRLNSENADVLQLIEVPSSGQLNIRAEGKGDAVLQVVKRYNLPGVEKDEFQAFNINVDYDTSVVAVNDIVKVKADIEFNPPVPVKAEMVVLDISVPTGFAALSGSLDKIIDSSEKIQRYDISGRKVIFYIVDMSPGEKLSVSFDIKALFPVRAEGTATLAYSYYNPEQKGEVISKNIVVN
ncbi:alpha-2-macroglobulin family protein [Chloroflexota bacterium]